MDLHTRRQRAIDKIRIARDTIVRVAAAWQRDGRDTTPLSQPLIDVQEALAELESAVEGSRSRLSPMVR